MSDPTQTDGARKRIIVEPLDKDQPNGPGFIARFDDEDEHHYLPAGHGQTEDAAKADLAMILLYGEVDGLEGVPFIDTEQRTPELMAALGDLATIPGLQAVVGAAAEHKRKCEAAANYPGTSVETHDQLVDRAARFDAVIKGASALAGYLLKQSIDRVEANKMSLVQALSQYLKNPTQPHSGDALVKIMATATDPQRQTTAAVLVHYLFNLDSKIPPEAAKGMEQMRTIAVESGADLGFMTAQRFTPAWVTGVFRFAAWGDNLRFVTVHTSSDEEAAALGEALRRMTSDEAAAPVKVGEA